MMNKKQKEYTAKDIRNLYGIPARQIYKLFPRPMKKVYYNKKRGYNIYREYWTEEMVRSALEHPELSRYVAQKKKKEQEEINLRKAQALIEQYSFDGMIREAQQKDRFFVLHVGPTNSGKTFDAMEDLKKNQPGTYLGPLRLLALEMYERLNGAGVPCTLLTGEEHLPVKDATSVSSTIELCDFHTQYKTAVIDEAQLIADRERGAAWLKAICLVNAEVLHICMSPEALPFLRDLIETIAGKDRFCVVEHKRLAPLRYKGQCTDYSELKPDDALICFSRKSVLATAAELEKEGIRASVIYGALPPEARRNEVKRYLNRETTVVVATDAIGMGISLPIHRIIFTETEKYDGKKYRQLTTSEVNQIAGRAGRYGLQEEGEVLVMNDSPLIRELLGKPSPRIKRPCISFPKETLTSDVPIESLLRVWQTLPRSPLFDRENMENSYFLYKMLLKMFPEEFLEKDRDLVFEMITCPCDVKQQELMRYWCRCVGSVLKQEKGKNRVPYPHYPLDTLEGCELQYKAYDLRHQILRRLGVEDDCTKERKEICRRIDELMKESKEQYIRRCRICGNVIPANSRVPICSTCSNNEYFSC